MSTLFAISIAALVLLASAGCGRAFSCLWRSRQDSRNESIVIDTVLGAGILSLLVFALGVMQLFSHSAIITLLGVAALAFFVIGYLRRNAEETEVDSSSARPISQNLSRSHQILALGLLLMIFIVVAIPALAPPAMSDWDSLAYHLAVPKLYVEHGGIYNIHIMSHAHFPSLMEMLYVPAVMCDLPQAAKLIDLCLAALLVAAVWLLASRHFNPKAAPMAVIGLAGMPIVMWLATTAYVDLVIALYCVLGVYLMLNYLDTKDVRYIVGSAFAAGFAASTKMTGLVPVFLILVWLLLDCYFATKKLEWKQGLIFVFITFAVCSPWYIKSIIYTGSPVYPFFHSIFGGSDWSSELASHYATQQSKFGLGYDFASFLVLPYNLTFRSDAFYDRPGLFVGPMLLAALPLLFIAKYKSRKLLGLLGFFLVFTVIWFAMTQQSRYLIPGFAALAVLISAVMYQDDRFRRARVAMMAVFVATAALGVLTIWPLAADTINVVAGSETREHYLTRALDVYTAQLYMNENLPAKAKVALIGDTRGYYLNRDYLWADYGHSLEFSRQYRSVGEYIRHLKSQHVTHAMVNFRFYPARDKGFNPVYAAIDAGLFEQIYPNSNETSGVAVYQIK